MGIKVKRFSGASAGAICAALLAAGYDCKELEKELERDLDTVLLGTGLVLCSHSIVTYFTSYQLSLCTYISIH